MLMLLLLPACCLAGPSAECAGVNRIRRLPLLLLPAASAAALLLRRASESRPSSCFKT
jgi:hypothetical protein